MFALFLVASRWLSLTSSGVRHKLTYIRAVEHHSKSPVFLSYLCTTHNAFWYVMFHYTFRLDERLNIPMQMLLLCANSSEYLRFFPLLCAPVPCCN